MTTSGRRVAIGVQPHVTTRTMGILDVARHVADRGLASIFLCEHTHVPVDSARSESPLGRFPEWIKYMLDPYVALSFVAATTELEVGTAVGLPAQHDPIALAKAIATLDHLSGGRFVFGVGWGWLREEFEDHGGSGRTSSDSGVSSCRSGRSEWIIWRPFSMRLPELSNERGSGGNILTLASDAWYDMPAAHPWAMGHRKPVTRNLT